MVSNGRMVTSSRRAGRVTNKTKLLIYRGSDKVDLAHAEVILWTDGDGESAPKNQHVGAKGVESGEMLEHHLQAALSSHSLLHSQSATKPTSPASSSRLKPSDATAGSSSAPAPAALNYHIPTPDATGLTLNEDYLRLYQSPNHRYHEPSGFIRFSDTVEEASGGWGGLGYCMDDEDEKWLSDFNGKQQGGSGSSGQVDSPAREGKENVVPVSASRERRGKGKDREKDKDAIQTPPPPLVITEDAFEFVMGMLEKYADEVTPPIHTNLSLLPTYAMVESLFSSPISPSFLPSNEVPRFLPDTALLTRMSRSIYTHWKSRRERRKGRPVMPQLNYDETNDGDPYVCFRRRDIRATRKTRRTDNFSVEQMQKLQYELRAAHEIAKLTVRRESEKKALYAAEKDVWEAKWKLYETKKRWPTLGLTQEEEEILIGKMGRGHNVPSSAGTSAYGASINVSALNGGQGGLRLSKKTVEREKEAEREKRERMAELSSRDKSGLASRWFAPDELKARMQALRQKLEEEMGRRRESDMDWDDATDMSYQPLPSPQGDHAYRSVTALDPHWAREQSETDYTPSRLPTFRLRRGRNGIEHLDRRCPSHLPRRGAPPSPTSTTKFSDWLFPDTCSTRLPLRRPKSIDDDDEDLETSPLKRQRLNETWRYNADNGGAIGVGMGLDEDSDQIIIDDMDSKYIRHRITLLRDDDLGKLQPDQSVIQVAMASIDEPQELPPMPIFIRPPPPQNTFVNAQLAQQAQLAAQQQQAQMEQFRQFQLQAQMQAQLQIQAAQQQAAQAAAANQQQLQLQQQQQQQQGSSDQTAAAAAAAAMHQRLTSNGSNGSVSTPMPPPTGQPQNGRPPVKRTASAMSNSNGNSNGSMPPPSQPPNHPQNTPLPNGQSPQMMNGTPNKTLMSMAPPSLQLQAQAVDPAFQQRLIAQARATQHAQQQLHQQQQLQQQQQLLNNTAGGQGGGGATDMNDNNIAALNALIANTANVQQQQQAQVHMQMQVQQMQNAAAAAAAAASATANGSGAGVGAGVVGTNGTAPDLHQQAQAAGFNNIQAFIDFKNKSRMRLAAQAVTNSGAGGGASSPAMSSSAPSSSVQVSPVSSQNNSVGATANGNGNGTAIAKGTTGANGGGQAQNGGSTMPPNAHMQLKLPPHAKARLAGQQQVIVQRAQ